MYETQVTIVGNVVTPVDKRELSNGTAVAKFRVGSTERRYDRATGGWVDGDRLYVEVSCWRSLAQNAAASLVKGDPVVVTGRLYTRNYEHEGQRRSSTALDAYSVAADLSHCTAVVTRTRKGVATEAAVAGNGDRAGQRVPAEVDAVEVNTGPLVDHDTAGSGPRLVAAAPAGEG
jgi:single-strand DNA-binding protein